MCVCVCVCVSFIDQWRHGQTQHQNSQKGRVRFDILDRSRHYRADMQYEQRWRSGYRTIHGTFVPYKSSLYPMIVPKPRRMSVRYDITVKVRRKSCAIRVFVFHNFLRVTGEKATMTVTLLAVMKKEEKSREKERSARGALFNFFVSVYVEHVPPDRRTFNTS